MRQITFVVSADVDDSVVELIGKRYGRTFQQALTELAGDIECRLTDSIRFRDGIECVRSYLIDGTCVEAPHVQ